MILITGGLGYIGSHVASQLITQGREVVLVDNLSNTNMQVLERLEYLHQRYIPFIKLDIRNTPALIQIFDQYSIHAVINCTGFKSFSEAQQRPLDYYNNNLNCVLSLMRAMQRANVRRLVHLSSLMVYGVSSLHLDEKQPFNYLHRNAYVRSQQMVEDIIADSYQQDPNWNIIVLRLSNIIGACEHGILGELIPAQPKSFVALAMQVAARQRDTLKLHQYSTDNPEGTVERNFLHVLDAVDAIVKSLHWLSRHESGYDVFNISGSESIHLQKVINELSRISLCPIMTQEVQCPDPTTLLQVGAKNFKAHCTLQWRAYYNFQAMLEHQWNFYQHFLRTQP